MLEKLLGSIHAVFNVKDDAYPERNVKYRYVDTSRCIIDGWSVVTGSGYNYIKYNDNNAQCFDEIDYIMTYI